MSTTTTASTEYLTIHADDWFDQYKPIPNHLDQNAIGWLVRGSGTMFEMFGEELAYVLKIARSEPQIVWTIIDADGKCFITNGFHFVNRLGYFITEEPFAPNQIIEVPYT